MLRYLIIAGLKGRQVLTTEGNTKLDEVERCTAYWAAVGPFHPRFEATVMKIVAAREEVCDQLVVIFGGVRRGDRGWCRGKSFGTVKVGSSCRGGEGGIDVEKVAKTDNTSVSH
jgi:hypothetical protein